MNNKRIDFKSLIKKNRTLICWILAILCFALSFIQYSASSPEREARKVQKRLAVRAKILDEYAQKAINTPSDTWLNFDLFPEDMVLYKYDADTLQSWINLFPISNDEVDLAPLWYRIHDMNNRNLFNTPLAYLGDKPQYVNLGSSWYVVKVYKKGLVKIIAGLLIKTEYINQNSVLTNSINSKLGLDEHFTTVPVNVDDSNVIFTKDGAPLFSIISDVPINFIRSKTGIRWIAILLALFALFSYHASKRNFKSLTLVIAGLVIIRLVAMVVARPLLLDSTLFSPSLYADGEVFNSLGNLLLNHASVFLMILAMFMVRIPIIKNINSSKEIVKRLKSFILYLIPLLLIVYIHFTLRSLLLNSGITLELFMIQELTIYSILVYASYALLFMALLFSLQLIILVRKKYSKVHLFSIKSIIVYILVISVYSVGMVSYFGFKKEFERNRVLTNKLAIERDLSLELQLRSIEAPIVSDPLIRLLVTLPQGGDLIKSRLEELYLWNISQKYDIRVTICGESDKLSTENYSHLVDCFEFFQKDIIDKYGMQLAPRSPFYYVNNYKSRVSYIGVFSFYRNSKWNNLYIEIDSKIIGEVIGYPSLLLDPKKIDDNNIPDYYSYAKYYDLKLTSYHGRYNYPVIYNQTLKDGYYYQSIGGYLHFINKISDESCIIISRPVRSIIPYLVSFSYMVLFYALILFGLTRLRKKKRGEVFNLPRNSFRKKIAYLMTTSMVIALICMAIGSVAFTINLINENNRIQMEEKLSSVQTTITEMCKYADQYNEINTMEMFNAMDKVASNTQVDINLYDPHGRLIRSTKPEVFDQYLIGSRMNPNAYNQLVLKNKRQVINKESIASLEYYSLYAPIFNVNGTMVAIANIPYFLNTTGVREDASSIIATIINLYLLLLLAAVVAGATISNSITKPLALISKKMQDMSFSRKAEHIDYKGQDELGSLVKAYNEMVDDLEKSSMQLAQSEREQAWREMARQIAHEIKNPLTPMRLSIQHLVRLHKQNVPDWQERFDAVAASLLEQIDILSETATEFSSFAKFYNEDNTVVDLVEVIKEQYILFDTRDNITFSFINEYESANIFAKKSQITRALVNLISNAIQAIESKKDGLLKITLSKEEEFYRLDIEDNGPGVSIENYKNLFKPNFTTKSGGTGLGLAICKNIFDQSQGSISYKRSEMGGADFIVKVPILK